MAEEHIHSWQYQQNDYGEVLRRCACGVEKDQETGDFLVPTSLGALNTMALLEQQLAQARDIQASLREEINALRDHDLAIAIKQRDEARVVIAQARVLLEAFDTLAYWPTDPGETPPVRYSFDPDDFEQLAKKIRAFLADKEQDRGK